MGDELPSELPHEELMYLCRKSPSYYAGWVLGFDQAKCHIEFQRHLTIHDECYIEEHRGLGKTSQLAGVRNTWEIGNDPNVRIKYVMQNDSEAKKTGMLMQDIIESDAFREVFPGVVPDQDQWAAGSFSVKTTHFSRDPTVQCSGIFGRASGRADILNFDDICDWKNAIKSPTDRESVKDAYATNWLPMLDASSSRVLKTWKVGTCYHVNDITADWRRQHREDGTLLRRPVIDFVSPWAEVCDRAYLEKQRKSLGPIAYARAYELQPVSSDQMIFDSAWLDAAFYEEIPIWRQKNGSMVCLIDWAYSEKKGGDDPDYSVCLICWMTDDGHVYVVDLLKGRWAFPEFMRRMIDVCDRLNVTRGWAESGGPQKGIVQQANMMSPFPISGITRDRDKIIRATEIQSFVECGKFHLKATRSHNDGTVVCKAQLPIYEELVTFPASGHDDIVDTVIDACSKAVRSSGKIEVHKFQTRKPVGSVAQSRRW